MQTLHYILINIQKNNANRINIIIFSYQIRFINYAYNTIFHLIIENEILKHK